MVIKGKYTQEKRTTGLNQIFTYMYIHLGIYVTNTMGAQSIKQEKRLQIAKTRDGATRSQNAENKLKKIIFYYLTKT